MPADQRRKERAASLSELPEGGVLGVEVAGEQIALYNLGGGEIRATDNICTHEYACLSEGWFEDGIVECPLHDGRFDVRTGRGQGAPITTDLKVYPVLIEGGEIFVVLD